MSSLTNKKSLGLVIASMTMGSCVGFLSLIQEWWPPVVYLIIFVVFLIIVAYIRRFNKHCVLVLLLVVIIFGVSACIWLTVPQMKVAARIFILVLQGAIGVSVWYSLRLIQRFQEE